MSALTAPVVLLLALLVDSAVVRAQDSTASRPDSGVSLPRLGLIGVATTGAFVYGHVLQTEIWWKGARSDFFFEWERDWRYSLGADKLGHAWFPYIVAHTYDELLLWSGIDSATSIWTAASLALGYQTFVEIRDGFSAEWGFSVGDYAADLIGAALPVAQHYIPALRTVRLKVSYYPSERWQSGAHAAIIDDYESTYHWVSVAPSSMLPSTARAWYPEFINLALGHSVKGLDGTGGGSHELYLALDWNLDNLGADWWLWDLLRSIVRHYHLPAPSLRIYPGPLRFGILL